MNNTDKLKQYENTGLSPKDIEQMKARLPLHQWSNESTDKISIFGVSVKRIMELVKADKQGKLLMSPCDVNDTVWIIAPSVESNIDENKSLCVYECIVKHIIFCTTGRHHIRLYNKETFVTWQASFSDFGKTVFLTKDEAEYALSKM